MGLVPALRETPDLWGGKLKHLETPTRNRILDFVLSQSHHPAAKGSPTVSNIFVAQRHVIILVRKAM